MTKLPTADQSCADKHRSESWYIIVRQPTRIFSDLPLVLAADTLAACDSADHAVGQVCRTTPKALKGVLEEYPQTRGRKLPQFGSPRMGWGSFSGSGIEKGDPRSTLAR